jgi:hypothetical protein
MVHDEYKAAPNVPRVTAEGAKTYQEIDDRGYQGLKFDETESDLAYGVAATPKLSRKDGKPHDWNTIMTLYPNTNISLFPNFLLITILSPHAPDSTGYDTALLIPESVDEDARYFEKCEELIQRDWGYARNEDAAVLKRVQQGRKSPVYDQHFFRPSGNPCAIPFAIEYSMTWKVSKPLRGKLYRSTRPNPGLMYIVSISISC